jgi:hypothetical protein
MLFKSLQRISVPTNFDELKRGISATAEVAFSLRDQLTTQFDNAI